jgi:NAD(P)-dependent dehydrogenase (short-subunit alcohol dehydrogenase family)
MDLGLTGKVALVTGAGSQKGYGKGIALVLAKEGCDVIVSDIDLEGAQKTADEIISLGRKALAIKVDLTKSAEINQMVKSALEEFGKIDILVNNAGGITSLKLFTDRTEEEWDKELNLNLKAVMVCTNAVLPQMIARKSGKIINVSSIGAGKGMAHTVVYNAAKAAVVNFTKGIGVAVAPHGINVNSVAPGLGLTNFGGGAPLPGGIDKVIERIPIRRSTTPEDLGNMVAFLASDVSGDVVAQNIGVDGGESVL